MPQAASVLISSTFVSDLGTTVKLGGPLRQEFVEVAIHARDPEIRLALQWASRVDRRGNIAVDWP